MSAFNFYNKQELKISLFHEIIMSFIIEKHCYNGEIGDDIFYNMYKIRLTIVLSENILVID